MITITNLDQVKREIRKGNLVVIEAAGQAVTEITTGLARQANELVPFDTGNLARSRVIKYPKKLSDKPVGEVSYGGPAAPYAVVQHESLDFFHPPKPPNKSKVGGRQGTGPVAAGTGRGPKYLEYPLKRYHKVFNKILIRKINKAIKRMGT